MRLPIWRASYAPMRIEASMLDRTDRSLVGVGALLVITEPGLGGRWSETNEDVARVGG